MWMCACVHVMIPNQFEHPSPPKVVSVGLGLVQSDWFNLDQLSVMHRLDHEWCIVDRLPVYSIWGRLDLDEWCIVDRLPVYSADMGHRLDLDEWCIVDRLPVYSRYGAG